jgi:hypothetical protein
MRATEEAVHHRSRQPSRVTPPAAITAGSVDASDWLRARGIATPYPNWFVEIAMGTSNEPATTTWSDADTRFHVYIYPGEWSFLFSHAGLASWIRMADRPYIHHRDDHELLGISPPLREISDLMRSLEARHGTKFRRDRALVRTNLSGVNGCVHAWVAQL